MGHDFVALERTVSSWRRIRPTMLRPDARHFEDAVSCHSGCRRCTIIRAASMTASNGWRRQRRHSDQLVQCLSRHRSPNPERDKAQGAAYLKLRGLAALSPAAGAKAVMSTAAELRAIRLKYPEPRATFDDYMAHMLHALKLVGSDHVGVGADWDGGGGVTGMEDCASNWKITARLLREGYREDDLRKIWGGNALRLMQQVQDARRPAQPPAQPNSGGE
jgi:hypothetical protein